MTKTQMESAVQFLKHRLRADHTTFIGHTTECNQVKELISRTSESGESNSALVIGPIGCGKTTVSIFIGLLVIKSLIFVISFSPLLHNSDDFIDSIASSAES